MASNIYNYYGHPIYIDTYIGLRLQLADVTRQLQTPVSWHVPITICYFLQQKKVKNKHS